jgi:hypothetical protein
MKQEEMIFSYQTRLKGDYPACSSYAKLFGCLERKLFAALMGQKDPVLLKNLYIKDNGITARQFNSLLYQVTGKIQAAKELQKLHSQELEEKIADLKKQLPKFKDQVLFGKKRRLALKTPCVADKEAQKHQAEDTRWSSEHLFWWKETV